MVGEAPWAQNLAMYGLPEPESSQADDKDNA